MCAALYSVRSFTELCNWFLSVCVHVCLSSRLGEEWCFISDLGSSANTMGLCIECVCAEVFVCLNLHACIRWMYVGIAWRGKGDIPSLCNFITLISALKASCQCCVPTFSLSFSLSLSLLLYQVIGGATFSFSSPHPSFQLISWVFNLFVYFRKVLWKWRGPYDPTLKQVTGVCVRLRVYVLEICWRYELRVCVGMHRRSIHVGVCVRHVHARTSEHIDRSWRRIKVLCFQ